MRIKSLPRQAPLSPAFAAEWPQGSVDSADSSIALLPALTLAWGPPHPVPSSGSHAAPSFIVLL